MDNIKRNKLYFLLNPFAGNGNAYNVFKEAKKTLESHDIEVKYHLSLSSGDIQRFIIEEDLTDYDGICVVGGDGTIHEAVEGLMLSGKSQYLSLGVIPCGSGNAFAEDLELRDHGDAVEKIITGKTSLIDVMKVNSKENISYAVNIIGWGIAILSVLLLKFSGWIWGVVVGFRGSVLWGFLNMFFYAFSKL